MLVFLNKTDVVGGMQNYEVRKVREGAGAATVVPELTRLRQALELDKILTHNWIIVGCSAITGENLTKGLGWVVQDARDRLFLY